MNFYTDELSEKEKEKLLKEFSKLDTIESKFAFWKQKLHCSYHNRGFIEYEKWVPFKIHSESSEQNKEINIRCLNELDLILGKNKNADYKIVKFERLAKDFEDNILNKTPNKKNAINLEIEKLRETIHQSKALENHRDYIVANSVQFFNHSYDNYILNNQEPDYSSQVFSDRINLVMMNNGFHYAKYKLYLEDLLIPKKQKNIVTLSEITTNQQLLFLHYTDYLNTFDLNVNTKGDLLGALFNKGAENYRKGITNISKLKTRKNLEYLDKFFDKFGLSNYSKLVKKDIDKLKD